MKLKQSSTSNRKLEVAGLLVPSRRVPHVLAWPRANVPNRRGAIGGALAGVFLLVAGASMSCERATDSIAVARRAATAAPAPQDLVNFALNTSGSPFPNTIGTDPSWGCSNTVDLVDGLHSYPDWCHGHAFTGGHQDASGGPPWIDPAGPRHLILNFSSPKTFQKVVLWWHGVEYTPDSATLEVGEGGTWTVIPNVVRDYGRMHEDGANGGYSDSDEYTFAPVTGSQFRYTFDNSGHNIVGTWNIHGWLYEVEIFGKDECPSDIPVPASLHSEFGVLLGSQKPYRIGLEDVYPTFTTKGSAGRAGVSCHLESRMNSRTMYIGPDLFGPIPGPLATPFPIGEVRPDVDLDFYADGGHPVPGPCHFGPFQTPDNDCILNTASASPRLVNWTTPGFRLAVLGISKTLMPRSFWVDLAAIPGIAPDAALSVTVDAVEDVVEATIAANIVFAQSYWALAAEPPLDVLVTDPAGRRTGPADNGSILTQIPGTMHFQEGDIGAVLMFRPDPGRYAARIVGQAGEPFSLSISTADLTNDPTAPVLREWSTSGTVDTKGTSFDFALSDNSLVVDITPPTLTLRSEPEVLWPPDGRLHRVRVDVRTTDDIDQAPKVVLESVTCEDGCRAAADVVGAALGTDDRDMFLRAEWHGPRRSRTYKLTYAVSDEAGNVTREFIEVPVAQPQEGPTCHRPGL